MNRSPPEQGLKSHLRGDGINRLRPLQQSSRMQTICTDTNAGMNQILWPEVPPRSAMNDVGMHFHDNRAGRMIRQCFLQHLTKILRAGPTEGNRAITGRLIHHQHKALLRNRRLLSRIHFAQPLLTPQRLNLLRSNTLLWRQRRCDQVLEPTGSSGIKVHPQIINEKRKRRIPSSLAEGAEKAILDVPNGKPPVLTEPFHPPRTRTTPPGQQRIDITTTARHQLSRRQQPRQGLMHKHAPGRHTESRSSKPGHRVRQGIPNPLRWRPMLQRWP